MFKWPSLIWSFDGLSDKAKMRVVAREPWRQWRRLTFYRAIGAYSYAGYRKFFTDEGRRALLPLVISLLPAVALNGLTALYWFLFNRDARAGIYDLARSRNASSLTRLIAHRLGVPTL
jgi:abequosyltransferase